ncbi:scm-like with four MBT domains protein 1 [Mya arenaria]|uniref:scm-like with four MBT domains protein 1 n=1 Tax=Mya arenaria TaxID=6604 RepID=UPI0022E98753|nr:scm-like with four MBT domains protein 1 [Mya arenaria]
MNPNSSTPRDEKQPTLLPKKVQLSPVQSQVPILQPIQPMPAMQPNRPGPFLMQQPVLMNQPTVSGQTFFSQRPRMAAQISNPPQAIQLANQGPFVQYSAPHQPLQIGHQPMPIAMSMANQTISVANQSQHFQLAPFPRQTVTPVFSMNNAPQVYSVGNLQVSSYQSLSPSIQMRNPLQGIQLRSFAQPLPQSPSKTPPPPQPAIPKSPGHSSGQLLIAPKVNPLPKAAPKVNIPPKVNLPRAPTSQLQPIQVLGNKVAIPRHGLAQCTTTQYPIFQQSTSVPIMVSTESLQSMSFSANPQFSFRTQIQSQIQPDIKSPQFGKNDPLPSPGMAFNSFPNCGQMGLQPGLAPGTYMPMNIAPGLSPVSPIANLGSPFIPRPPVQLQLSAALPPKQVMLESAARKSPELQKETDAATEESMDITSEKAETNEEIIDEVYAVLNQVFGNISEQESGPADKEKDIIEDGELQNSDDKPDEIEMDGKDGKDEQLELDSDVKHVKRDFVKFPGKVYSKRKVVESYCDYESPQNVENFHELVLKLRQKKKADVEVETATRDASAIEKDVASKSKTKVNEGMKKENRRMEIKMPEFTAKDVSHDGKKLDKDETEHKVEEHEGEEDEPQFIWEEYLRQVGAEAVPSSAFKHVEHSLESGFVKGMKLEVKVKSNSNSSSSSDNETDSYWVATVMMTCGPLLRLRYDGYKEEGAGEFWCDLATTEVHPIGWCAANQQNLQPPEEIRDSVEDWHEYLKEVLTGARTAPPYLLEKGGSSSPIDQLKCSMRLEMQDELNPLEVWLVQILENVGGRLYLRLEGTNLASKHFWMFYLDMRLHPLGWATENGCTYKPPADVRDEKTDEEWTEILQTAMSESENDLTPAGVFKDQLEPKTHQFQPGMRLEALVPGANYISPATVTKVINDKYFLIEIDDIRPPGERESVQICCHSEYLGIFPVSWCLCKGIKLMPPAGWSNGDFVWGEYLSRRGAKAAPEKLFNSGTDDHEYERGMKLEAVNPTNPNQICAATITKIVDPLLWVHLDHQRDIPSHIQDIDSHNLFPVGWCESNQYDLKPPVKAKRWHRRHSDIKTEEVYRAVASERGDKVQASCTWCPRIYINHKCFSGPHLSKGRIADIPCSVGPGPMDLVLKQVLSLLISVAYKSSKALKELEIDGDLNPYMVQHVLKAKYKGKSYSGVVEVCQKEDHMEEFLRNICVKLECCPYLISTLHVARSCPENCQQMTKTKYNYSYGSKKRKPAALLASKQAVKNSISKLLKKGRKKKTFLLTRKKGSRHERGPVGLSGVGRPALGHHRERNGDFLDEGFIDGDEDFGVRKRKHSRALSQYEIQTRGAKLPKYSFEKKTHRKIYASERYASSNCSSHSKPYVMYPHVQRLRPRPDSLKLDSNPLYWSVDRLVQFIKSTDCSHFARIIKEQEVDGQAFLLLDLSTVQEHLELKLGPAVKLCHQIERLKVAFYENYA